MYPIVKKYKARSLVFDAILYITIAFIFITAALILYNLLYEFKTTQNDINSNISNLISTSEKTLINSVWEINQAQTETILKGILDSPLVIGVKLVGPDDQVIHQAGAIPKKDLVQSHDFFEQIQPEYFYIFQTKLLKRLGNNFPDEHIGTLYVYSGNVVIYEQVSKVVTYIFIFSSIQTVCLWIILVLFFNRKIKKPFDSLINKISNIDPQSPRSIPLDKNFNSIEIFKIITTFNNVITELRNFKDVLEAILENKTELLKEKNIEVRELLQKLEQTQEHLINQEKLNSLGLVSAGIAHELKNPLNISLNSILILRDIFYKIKLKESDPETYSKVEQLLHMIDSNNKKMDNIIKNMLLQSRTLYIDSTPIELNSFITTNLTIVQKSMKLESSNATIVVIDIAPDIIINVFPNEFGRLFVNLFENSFYAIEAKFAKYSNTPELKYTPEIIISARLLPDDMIEISVKDNGTGIPDEIKNRIMEPFFTTKPPGVGTGLGLHLVYEIIKKHRGQVMINSKVGLFTNFKIIIPMGTGK